MVTGSLTLFPSSVSIYREMEPFALKQKLKYRTPDVAGEFRVSVSGIYRILEFIVLLELLLWMFGPVNWGHPNTTVATSHPKG